MSDDLGLIEIDAQTLFAMSSAKRIERQNDPDGSPASSLFFAGCSDGNLAHVRYDIDDEVADRLLTITANEPPWRDPWVLPQCIGKLLDVFSIHARPAIGAASRTPLTVGPCVIYHLAAGEEHSADDGRPQIRRGKVIAHSTSLDPPTKFDHSPGKFGMRQNPGNFHASR